MKKQTKELIRDFMIREFGNNFPELKGLKTFPILVTDLPFLSTHETSDTVGIYWIWILSDKKFIKYGAECKNICQLVSDKPINVFSCPVGTSFTKRGITVTVKKIRYWVEDVAVNDKVLVVENESGNLSNLITCDD